MKEKKKQDSKTGKYIYDEKLKKVVKISEEVPGLKKNNNKEEGNSCNGPSCSCCGN